MLWRLMRLWCLVFYDLICLCSHQIMKQAHSIFARQRIRPRPISARTDIELHGFTNGRIFSLNHLAEASEFIPSFVSVQIRHGFRRIPIELDHAAIDARWDHDVRSEER